MSRKALISVFILILAIGGGTVIWRVQNTSANDARLGSETLSELSPEDISLVLKSQSDTGGADLSQGSDARRAFLRGMREYLALAAAARKEGLTEDVNFKINFEYKKNLLLADLYKSRLGDSYILPTDESEAVWSDPGAEKEFDRDMTALQNIQTAVAKERGENYTVSKLQGGSLVKAKETWSRAKALSARAKADADFMASREVELRTKILEAGILSADYLRKHWAKSIKATPSEIAAYLAAHPEFDVRKKREKAEIALRRALSGEDFSRLAAEFSEDRTSKDKGGLYENVAKGSLWGGVESAALALKEKQVAPGLIETETGFHIVKLESNRIIKGEGGLETVTYSVRHILLQRNFEEPGNGNSDVPPPFMKAEEIAINVIEKEKRASFVERIVQLNEIVLPENFSTN